MMDRGSEFFFPKKMVPVLLSTKMDGLIVWESGLKSPEKVYFLVHFACLIDVTDPILVKCEHFVKGTPSAIDLFFAQRILLVGKRFLDDLFNCFLLISQLRRLLNMMALVSFSEDLRVLNWLVNVF